MKKGVYLLPNGLTLCGMFFGFYSIVSSINGMYIHAGWGIIIASVFDGLDGWVARLTNSASQFGIELDSLSDLVAFGVAPSVMVFRWSLSDFGRIGWAVCFLFVSCGALRLARYNVQKVSEERTYFTGMPIPAAAGILAGLVVFYHDNWDIPPGGSFLVLALTCVLAILMISTLRFHGVKELDLQKRKPFWFLVIMIFMITIFVIYPPATLFAAGIVYLIWGLAENICLFYKKGAIHDPPPDSPRDAARH
jgi:CDP-diacylglycerol--serine O-phosphatidyltransferase